MRTGRAGDFFRESARRGPDRILPGAGHGRRAFPSRRRRKRRRSKRDSRRRTFLVEIDASLGGFDQKRRRIFYRTVAEKFSALPGVQHAGLSAHGAVRDQHGAAAVLRAGVPPAPDDKPATAAEGRIFTPFWNSVGADYFAAVELPFVRGRTFTTPKRPNLVDLRWPSSTKSWRRNCGRRVTRSGKEFNFPFGKMRRTGNRGRGWPDQTRRRSKLSALSRPSKTDCSKRSRSVRLLAFRAWLSKRRVLFCEIRFAFGEQRIRHRRPAAPHRPERRSIASRSGVEDALKNTWTAIRSSGLSAPGPRFPFSERSHWPRGRGCLRRQAYSVARRTREIGIRMALGAEGKTVQWMILREGFAMVTAGLALGLLLAFGTGKIVSSILFDVSSPIRSRLRSLPPFSLVAAARDVAPRSPRDPGRPDRCPAPRTKTALRYAKRSPLRLTSTFQSPAFTLVAVVTLGLGIAASTAIFSVVDAVLLHPLPYPHSEQIVSVSQTVRSTGVSTRMLRRRTSSIGRRRIRSSPPWPARAVSSRNLSGSEQPERVRTTMASARIFLPLRHAADSRTHFRTGGRETGKFSSCRAEPWLWSRRYGADRGVIGRDLVLDGEKFTIIGVMPPAFSPDDYGELWLPSPGMSLCIRFRLTTTRDDA